MNATQLSSEQVNDRVQVSAGDDGVWITLRTASGKQFTFQPVQQWEGRHPWDQYVNEWAGEIQAIHEANRKAKVGQ